MPPSRCAVRVLILHLARLLALLLAVLLAGASCRAQDGPWRAAFPGLPCGADSSIYAVQALDAGHCFAVGEDGAAHRSVDGGATWMPMDPAAGVDLYDLRFQTPLDGIACGDRGTVARTADGGATWTAAALPGFASRALYAITHLGGGDWIIAGGSSAVAHGQVAVPDGFLLRSGDGGATWTAVVSELLQFFWCVAGVPGAPGRALAASYGPQGGRILASDDGGRSWREQASRLPFLPHDIRCAVSGADTLCAACGGNPADFTAAGSVALRGPGASWSTAAGPPSGGFAWSLAAFADSGAAPALTVGTQAGQVWTRRLDGSWTREPDLPTGCPIYALDRKAGDAGRAPCLLAGGGGHGLFLRGGLPLSAAPPPRAAAGGMRLRCHPQPLTPSTGMLLTVVPSRRAGTGATSGTGTTSGTGATSGAAARLRVCDALGRTVLAAGLEFRDEGAPFTIDCSALPAGAYRCVLETASDASAATFIISR